LKPAVGRRGLVKGRVTVREGQQNLKTANLPTPSLGDGESWGTKVKKFLVRSIQKIASWKGGGRAPVPLTSEPFGARRTKGKTLPKGLRALAQSANRVRIKGKKKANRKETALDDK